MELFKFKTRDPVILALCTQEAFQKSLDKAKRRVEREKKLKFEKKKGTISFSLDKKESNDNNHEIN